MRNLVAVTNHQTTHTSLWKISTLIISMTLIFIKRSRLVVIVCECGFLDKVFWTLENLLL